MRFWNLGAGLLLMSNVSWAQPGQKCLFVSSYHHGYEWNDGIEEGVKKSLAGKCELKQFDMDTKRHPGADFAQKKAQEAKNLIEQWKPDVVIVSDDNTSKYLVMPFYKNHKIPFVFCGVNWSGQEYGYPYSNATGMIEVNAIKPLFEQIVKVKKDAKKATCLSVDNETDRKLCERFVKTGTTHGIEVKTAYVLKYADWKKAYIEAQKDDFVVLPTNAGINDWNEKDAKEFVLKNSKKLSVSVYDWMIPYSMLSMTNVAQEQGEYAGDIAEKILGGAKPSDIPIISNRKWNIWVNLPLADAAKIKLPEETLHKAEKVK